MTALAGPFFAAVLLLGGAGAVKLLRPDATRVALRSAGLPGTPAAARALGAVEVAIALAALAAGGPLPAAAVALAYVGFAGFSVVVRHRSAGRAGCGCFGASSAPVTGLHVAVNLVLAVVALTLTVRPLDGFGATVADTPAAGLPFLVLTVVLAGLLKATLTTLPELQTAMRPLPTGPEVAA